MGGACSIHANDEEFLQQFSRKPWMEEPIGRYNCVWDHKIKMDFDDMWAG